MLEPLKTNNETCDAEEDNICHLPQTMVSDTTEDVAVATAMNDTNKNADLVKVEETTATPPGAGGGHTSLKSETSNLQLRPLHEALFNRTADGEYDDDDNNDVTSTNRIIGEVLDISGGNRRIQSDSRRRQLSSLFSDNENENNDNVNGVSGHNNNSCGGEQESIISSLGDDQSNDSVLGNGIRTTIQLSMTPTAHITAMRQRQEQLEMENQHRVLSPPAPQGYRIRQQKHKNSKHKGKKKDRPRLQQQQQQQPGAYAIGGINNSSPTTRGSNNISSSIFDVNAAADDAELGGNNNNNNGGDQSSSSDDNDKSSCLSSSILSFDGSALLCCCYCRLPTLPSLSALLSCYGSIFRTNNNGSNSSPRDDNGNNSNNKYPIMRHIMTFLLLVIISGTLSTIIALFCDNSIINNRHGNIDLDDSAPPIGGLPPALSPEIQDRMSILRSKLQHLSPTTQAPADTASDSIISVFDNVSSPQYQSLLWLATEDEIVEVTVTAVSDNDDNARLEARYALAVLYYSTTTKTTTTDMIQESWINTLNFLSPSIHECNWNNNDHQAEIEETFVGMNSTVTMGSILGVECDPSYRIVGLSLSKSQVPRRRPFASLPTSH